MAGRTKVFVEAEGGSLYALISTGAFQKPLNLEDEAAHALVEALLPYIRPDGLTEAAIPDLRRLLAALEGRAPVDAKVRE